MVELGSRNERPMTRYFPEVVEAVKQHLPEHCCIDGEIIMIDPETGDRLNFDLLQQRIHPAASRIKKLAEGNPNLIDYLKNDEVSLIINTPNGKGARTDEGRIRAASVQYGVPCITTLSAGRVAVEAMQASRNKVVDVLSLQERFA
jgi:hypothetical protein